MVWEATRRRLVARVGATICSPTAAPPARPWNEGWEICSVVSLSWSKTTSRTSPARSASSRSPPWRTPPRLRRRWRSWTRSVFVLADLEETRATGPPRRHRQEVDRAARPAARRGRRDQRPRDRGASGVEQTPSPSIWPGCATTGSCCTRNAATTGPAAGRPAATCWTRRRVWSGSPPPRSHRVPRTGTRAPCPNPRDTVNWDAKNKTLLLLSQNNNNSRRSSRG